LAGIHVEQNIESLLPCVLADPVVLSQCIQNLVINAMKYRGQHSWIGISAQLVESKLSCPEIQLSVHDRGIGIRESEQRRVFGPFYRSPEVVTANLQGTGLGLTVVRRGITEMGGRVTVVSAIGVGSTFTIYLPVAALPPMSTPDAEPVGDIERSR
jgi:signal transduction histidine kinase